MSRGCGRVAQGSAIVNTHVLFCVKSYPQKHAVRRPPATNTHRTTTIFYDKWLDQSMTYSSAYFEKDNQNLFDAQISKYKQIAKSLNLNENYRMCINT